MYTFEQTIRVMLEFRAMDAPVEINVPWSVLRYLDTHADRFFASDGTVVYRKRGEEFSVSRMLCAAYRQSALVA